MVAEAFLKGNNIQCGLDAVKKYNEEWTSCIVMIIAFNFFGFTAVIFVIFRIYKYVKARHAALLILFASRQSSMGRETRDLTSELMMLK